MNVLHVLPTGGMGWSGGIRPTLRHLAAAEALAHHSFELAGLADLQEVIARGHPDVLAWHVASSWKLLPRLLRRRSLPLLLFEHHYCAGFEQHTVPSTRRFRTMLRFSYGAAARVVAVSLGQKRWMEEARLVDERRLRLICSSRPLQSFLALPPPPPPTAGAPIRLLSYGRFTPQKGFDRLIRALRRLPEAPLQLNLVGDGPQRRELERLAAADSRIRVEGPSADIPARLGEADVVVIPSRWEPWGNVCLEARAAARPVVVTGVDGLPEQVQNCGLVVPAVADESEGEQLLAAALEALGNTPAQERLGWSRQARRSTAGAWTGYVDGWRRLLEEFR
jgi:glycosyltransferase involved in cell wall biosynthesis